jgi:hypothetical protein
MISVWVSMMSNPFGTMAFQQHRSLLQLLHEMLGMLLMLLEELEAGFQ